MDRAVLAWFRAAAGYLHRRDLRCARHGVAHTGKLARAIVLDLSLFDATGDSHWWDRAVERAGYVLSRAAPDPEHGALIYLPGRFDPRNCSNSVIDSGECTDALAWLLRHARASHLEAGVRGRLLDTVERNAETYLCDAIVNKGITNQRLWGAMGLASAYALFPRETWRDALRASLSRCAAEQRPDGGWGYQPDAREEGAHPGAADLTVYYHGRCLAFLQHILEHVPEVDVDGAGARALARGLAFFERVLLPNGLTPLSLEGKRWFWDGSYEAGSAAYTVFALMRAGETAPRLTTLAERAWQTLAAHQREDGAIVACRERGAHDFVCEDFHTADLAWTALVMGQLRSPGSGAALGEELSTAEGASTAARAIVPTSDDTNDVVRVNSANRTVLMRRQKLPCNTQFGGAFGAGTLCAVTGAGGEALLRLDRGAIAPEGCVALFPRRSWRRSIQAARRFMRSDPPGREGRQWLFVARVLLRQGRPLAAIDRLWRGWIRPALEALRDPAASQWALTAGRDGDAWVVQPARRDGSVPDWMAGTQLHRVVTVMSNEVLVHDTIERDDPGSEIDRLVYGVPQHARSLDIMWNGARRETSAGERVTLRPQGGAFRLSVRYSL